MKDPATGLELSFALPSLAAMVESDSAKDGESSDIEPGIKGVIENLENLNRPENFITDKMPSNFMFLGLILSAIPSAKIVHLRRSPMAICWSIFKHNFSGEGNGYGYDLDELAEYYLLYHDLMEFWQTRFPGMIYQLDYEALTENQEIETRRLLDFCGLDWEQSCLDFHASKRDVQTASQVQVRKKMYQGSSSAWMKYEQQLQPLVAKLEAIS